KFVEKMSMRSNAKKIDLSRPAMSDPCYSIVLTKQYLRLILGNSGDLFFRKDRLNFHNSFWEKANG
ncbi:MAG: hypothetical protein ACHQ1H_12160, partial [Nitrososphaerales archaeon]